MNCQSIYIPKLKVLSLMWKYTFIIEPFNTSNNQLVYETLTKSSLDTRNPHVCYLRCNKPFFRKGLHNFACTWVK